MRKLMQFYMVLAACLVEHPPTPKSKQRKIAVASP